jgi:hypothetical protein
MASFDDILHDDFEVNGIITHLGSPSEIPSLDVDQICRVSQPSTLSAVSTTTTTHLAASTKSSPFHHDAIIRVVSNYSDDEADYYQQDHQNRAFCASATQETSQAQNDDSTDESDIEAFLEYARDVVAYNNTPYDPEYFHDFEQLLGECIEQCFGNDDEADKDSLASDKDSAFSGYAHETGVLSYRHKQMLKKPLISELAANRIKGVIAQKKKDEQGLTTINGSFVSHGLSKGKVAAAATKPDVDSSDDSMVLPATTAVSIQTLKKFRVSRGGRKSRRSPESITAKSDSDSSENKKQHRRKPKQHRRMRKARKEKRKLPPRSRSSNDDNICSPYSLSTDGSPSASTISISAILSCSPADKEKVLRYLKEFAPQLYKTVVGRMDQEARASVSQLERGYHNDSGFLCTPERPLHRGPVGNNVERTITGVIMHKNRFPPTLKKETSNWKPLIDTSSVLRPSIIKAGVAFHATAASTNLVQSSNRNDRITLSLIENVERILRRMLERQVSMNCHSCNLPELIEVGHEMKHEKMTIGGMAVIHKFRAKKKAVLQAKFLQQSREGQTPSVMMPSSPGPPNSADSVSNNEDKRSPQQLDSFMAHAQSSTSSSSSKSSLTLFLEEQQRKKLRRLKESRRRNLPPNIQVQESHASLLQTEALAENGAPEKSSLSSDGLSSVCRASPFRHIKLPLQKKKDSNYEVLTPESSPLSVVQSVKEGGSDTCSPLLKSSSSLSSPTSSSGNSQKNNSFFAGGLKSDDINKIIIDPQSPEYLSPVRDSYTWDLSDHSRPTDNGLTSDGVSDENKRRICDSSDLSSRAPIIFDDEIVSTGHEHFGNSTSTSPWSEMSFQSDPMRFPLSSSRKHQPKLSKSIGPNKVVSMQSTSKRCERMVTTESFHLGPSYNDSFDEIISRNTPFYNNEESPGRVMDVFFQSHLQCKEKNDFLSFVYEEDESDILFTDKEDDSLEASYGSPLQEVVFLTNTRFEI